MRIIEDTPTARLMFKIMSAFLEVERLIELYNV